ncbi:MAG: hypothetical protein ACEPOZ_09310 [Marinifilaceae bacterium]
MYAQVEKSKETRSRAVANSVAQKKSNVKQGFGFVDNRAEAVTQTILQDYGAGNCQSLQQKLITQSTIQRFPVVVENRGVVHKTRGGTNMTAKVGAASEWQYGSIPPGRVPNLLTKVGHYIQGTQRYIAGHLLNDNMGGQGVNDNLTVLSSNANKLHRGIESKVKDLATRADLINQGNNVLGDPNYDHGARYSVQVLNPTPAGKQPFSRSEQLIGAGLNITIDPIRIHKITKVESQWPEEIGGANDLTNYIVSNVPPYPVVPTTKKLTPLQKNIVKAINAYGAPTSLKDIIGIVQKNYQPTATNNGITLALKKGVKTKFFFKRRGLFSVITKNI